MTRSLMTLVLLATSCCGIVHADEIDTLRNIIAKSADPVARREALDKLKPLGRAAVPALRELLAHPEPTVRVLAIATLGELSSPQNEPRRHVAWAAIPDIIRLLEDSDVRVRRSAAYSLGWFWGPPGDGPRRDDIAKSAVTKLAVCLRDEDPKVREYSSRLLWRIADVAWDAVPELVAALEDQKQTAMNARKTLLYLGPPERAYTVKQLLAVLAAQPCALDVADWSAGLKWMGADQSEARADLGLSRFEALLYLGRKAADPAAKTAEPLLLKLAAESHPAVRFQSLAASAKLGLAKESPIPTLDTALAADDPNVVFWAAHAWVELHGVEAHKAVSVLAAAIPDSEFIFTPVGPTPEQKLTIVKAQLAIEALRRVGVRVPETKRR